MVPSIRGGADQSPEGHERILYVDDDFAHEVLRPREARDLVERESARRNHDRLTMSCGLLERAGGGFPFHLFQPRRESLALRSPRAQFHIVSAARKTATQCLTDIAASQNAHAHGGAEGGRSFSAFGWSGRSVKPVATPRESLRF